jgi:hypothetical protein
MTIIGTVGGASNAGMLKFDLFAVFVCSPAITSGTLSIQFIRIHIHNTHVQMQATQPSAQDSGGQTLICCHQESRRVVDELQSLLAMIQGRVI